MFFDRYEIHIQAYVHFINGKLIIFQSASPRNYFQNMYSIFTTKNGKKTRKKKRMKSKNVVHMT